MQLLMAREEIPLREILRAQSRALRLPNREESEALPPSKVRQEKPKSAETDLDETELESD